MIVFFYYGQDQYFNHPHKSYKTIHIGGTNGKGSTSHSLAAILQKAGYKVGLYTSPHLVDFRERIRVNGEMISKKYVIDFVENNFNNIEYIHPSFFELSMMMAFCYFREMNVDIAIIEVGLGGRLDSTNIISPLLSIITNISIDHTQFLGDTKEQIAKEKAGIIKSDIPVLIGESGSLTVKQIFTDKAKLEKTKIYFAEQLYSDLKQVDSLNDSYYSCSRYDQIESDLDGSYHIHNLKTILSATDILRNQGLIISDLNVIDALKEVKTSTGLRGRWEKLSDSPLTYCDTGHNVGGITYISQKLNQIECNSLRIIIGMVNDKDISNILSLLPTKAIYYFTQAQIPRALPAEELKEKATSYNLKGNVYKNVVDAYNAAVNDSSQDDFIFIGGSNFTVGDLLKYLE